MMKTKIIYSILLSVVATLFTGATISLAWLANAVTTLEVDDLSGGVVSEYFHCGDGSENDPFVITRPEHFYNLTQLYDKLDSFSQEDYYFQLGYDLNNDGDLEFFDYSDSGVYQEDYSDFLNMNYYEDFLPIGSEDKPFIGHFDGSNLTISKLQIQGEDNVGVFGYVDSTASIKDLYIKDLEINADDAYVGYIAGRVEDATCFENVYVNDCTLNTTNTICKWGYFGYCDNAASLEQFVASAMSGEEDEWGGSFNSKTYTNLLYNLDHSTTAETTNTFSGDGGYVVKKTASAKTDPNNNQVVYRLRDGSYVPLKFTDDTHTQAALGNTGYLVGSNIGTGANASPKVSSYKMVNLQNALTNTQSTNMQTTYNASNIAYIDSKLEVMTYQNGWKRIKDSHNENNNSTNRAITSYTKTELDNFGFQKYEDSRNSLQEALESSQFVHGIHFDNNAISISNLLTVPANTIRVNGKKVTTSYQLPKGSIDFNLKEEGIINFFAGTYNSSNVSLNFFSLYEVTRNNSGNITALTQIKKIYASSSGSGYIYQTGNSKPSGAGDLVLDVETVLHGNAPVINMMYYFEIPVNAGEYAMGVAGSTQGAYMIYLDLGANGGTESTLVDDFRSIDYRYALDIVEHSILLITYELSDEETLDISVSFNNNVYNIYATSDDTIEILVTTLNTNYTYYFNNTQLSSAVMTHTVST